MHSMQHIAEHTCATRGGLRPCHAMIVPIPVLVPMLFLVLAAAVVFKYLVLVAVAAVAADDCSLAI